MPRDLSHEQRTHPRPQRVGDEAVAEQMCIDPLLDPGAVRSITHELQNAARRQRLVVTGASPSQADEKPLRPCVRRAAVACIALDPPGHGRRQGNQTVTLTLSLHVEVRLTIAADQTLWS